MHLAAGKSSASQRFDGYQVGGKIEDAEFHRVGL